MGGPYRIFGPEGMDESLVHLNDRSDPEEVMRLKQAEYFRNPPQYSVPDLPGGETDGLGLMVPDEIGRGQQEFNRLTNYNDPRSRAQQHYQQLREGMERAQRYNQNPGPERQMQQPASQPQAQANPKHVHAMAFAKALGVPAQNPEVAFQAMTAMLRRIPLPVLLNPKRKQQTAIEFQSLLQQMQQPQASRMPVQPT